MAKAIMIQGTMSGVGKSLITAGLLRAFVEDGFRAVPFKSQNMSLNSYVTNDGNEMGRAQAVQAEAAGLKPDVRMNPILLKPTTDCGSHVIVNGVFRGNMKASEYFKFKNSLKDDIMKAYNSLAAESDIIVIEGAGSPAEINLKKDDIVNMGMAEMADCPVVIVGDIDRGGVFAQICGTIMLLDENERERVKAVVINKFRGDSEILAPGLDMLEERINIPVAGVVPMIDIDIDDEDSLSNVFEKKKFQCGIDIAVIKLPRMSNFTDFNALSYMNGVSVRYVGKPKRLGNADIIIIPGSKNTIADLLWLRKNGIEREIVTLAKKGVLVFGICGGFQMLGETIDDLENLEGGGTVAGMGLLPVKTTFSADKVTTKTKGRFLKIEGEFSELSGKKFDGYEIHMGKSCVAHGKELTEINFGKQLDGAFHKNVAGTYVHGIFDSRETAEALISTICRRRGIEFSKTEAFDLKKYKESQYDMLSKTIRENVNMDMIYDIMGLERK
ncbi:MAG: cobyric acid synthase [Firmicutes bacterium]|nr:cobyric acid synthase [Bacillota bacterium]